jgi:hypothetical protein
MRWYKIAENDIQDVQRQLEQEHRSIDAMNISRVNLEEQVDHEVEGDQETGKSTTTISGTIILEGRINLFQDIKEMSLVDALKYIFEEDTPNIVRQIVEDYTIDLTWDEYTSKDISAEVLKLNEVAPNTYDATVKLSVVISIDSI